MAFKIGLGLTQTEHEGKMKFIPSISTCSKCNKLCQLRIQNKEAVCAHCYADQMLDYRKNLVESTERNHEILSDHLFTRKELKDVKIKWTEKMLEGNPKRLVRLEAFGDVDNVTQARNYIRIVKANRGCHFAVWSKNSGIWAKAFELEGKPKWLMFVLSSLRVNKPDEPGPRIAPYVDHVFTVYNSAHIAEHGTKTNCAGKSCAKCGRCYRKNPADFYVNEKLRAKGEK